MMKMQDERIMAALSHATILLPFMGVSGEVVSLMGFFLPFLTFGSVFLLGIVYVMYGIVGPVRTFQGHDFHYALIGRWIERYLARDAAEG
jgi:uncharacterized Tic20 family protein